MAIHNNNDHEISVILLLLIIDSFCIFWVESCINVSKYQRVRVLMYQCRNVLMATLDLPVNY